MGRRYRPRVALIAVATLFWALVAAGPVAPLPAAAAGLDPRGTYNVLSHRTSPCCQDFSHTWTISTFDPTTGGFSGTGGPEQPNFTVMGTLTGSQITLHIVFQDGSGYTADVVGTVQSDLSMSGTFTDNLGQSGTWTATLTCSPTVTGSVVQVSPPPSLLPGGFASDTQISFFAEQQSVVLSNPLAADGLTFPNSGAPTSISAGTSVNSYFLHANSTGPTITLSGAVIFGTPVLGIMTSDSNLNQSDYLGASGTQYPVGITNRGLENDGDTVSFAPDGRTLSFTFVYDSPGDEVRVITASCGSGSGGELRVRLAPPTQTVSSGSLAELVATVTNSAGQPQPGIVVAFNSLSGPLPIFLGNATTDASGHAIFSFTDAPDVDTVVASFLDSNGNTHFSNFVQVTFTVHYSIEFKAWIPQPYVVDPEAVVATPWALFQPDCANVVHTGHIAFSEYDGNDHAGYDGAYKVLVTVAFDWDGQEILNFQGSSQYGTTHRIITENRSGQTVICEEVKTATCCTAAQQTGPVDFVVAYASANPLVGPAQALGTTIKAAAHASMQLGGNQLTINVLETEFPSHGIRIQRGGRTQLTAITNDVSCLQPHQVLGPEGLARLTLGLSGAISATDTVTVAPGDVGLVISQLSGLCGLQLP